MTDVPTIQAGLAHLMQAMTSLEADFEKGTWTFTAPDFTCGSGRYLFISEQDWKRFWAEARAADTSSVVP
jgi:hypothetical protein